MNLAGRHALVVGLGKSGAAAARLLRSRGAQVIAADDDDARVRAEPFEVFELELDVLWAGVQLAEPPR